MNDRRAKYWDDRLHNWALYYFGGGSLGGKSSLCMLAVIVPCWNEESREQALEGDAMDTANLVHKLIRFGRSGLDQQKALKAWYWSSGTKDFVARSMGIHRETLRERVKEAKERLDQLQDEARRGMQKAA